MSHLKYSSTIIGNKNLHIINTLLCCIMKCTMLHFIMCYYFMSINMRNSICIVSCKYTLYKYFIYKHIFYNILSLRGLLLITGS